MSDEQRVSSVLRLLGLAAVAPCRALEPLSEDGVLPPLDAMNT